MNDKIPLIISHKPTAMFKDLGQIKTIIPAMIAKTPEITKPVN